jgi:glyoxylase-like metal-dependent hydrolase (beta-lactamase superfamily II)
MSSVAPSYRAYAIRYADREMKLSECYYAWRSYGVPDAPVTMSYFFWVLEPRHEDHAGPIVVDTGFAPERAVGRIPRITPREGLALLGIDPARVQRLVISHMHYDHIGNLHLFPRARITIAGRDYEFWAADPVAKRLQFGQHTDWNGVELLRKAEADGRLEMIAGETEIAPGLTALDVGGHSPGQLIFDVAGVDGDIALASDAIHYYDELDDDRPFLVFSDLADVYRAYERLRERVADGAALVAGHDPAVMQRFPRLDGAAGEHVVSLERSRSE